MTAVTATPLYSDEAIIRSVTYSTRGGHKVSFEMDPEGWEVFKGMETTRCMMVLVPIQNDGQPDPDAKPNEYRENYKAELIASTDKPRQRMSDMSRTKQAGILCNDPEFYRWLVADYRVSPDPETSNADIVAQYVRELCGVISRASLDSQPEGAGKLWDQLRSEFDAARGAIGRPDERT